MRVEQTARLALLLAWGVASIGCQSILVPTRPDANWRVHDTGHFLLHARPGSFADEEAARIGGILEDHYAHVLRTLDLRYGGRITMFLYSSRSEVDPPLDSDHSGIAFSDTEAVNIVCVPPLDANLASLLTHETNHVIMGRGIGRHGTRFMNEGMASAVMSETFFPLGPTQIHGWARQQANLPRIVDLADDDRWASNPQDVAYRTSASFLLYVLQRFGSAPLRQLYTVRSADFQRRAGEVLGRSLGDVEREWRAFLAEGQRTR